MMFFEDDVERLKQEYGKYPQRKKDEKEVIEKYGQLFRIENIDKLTREDVTEFFQKTHNKHWSNLQRNSGSITEDMGKLKRTLKILLDEKEGELKDRLERIADPSSPDHQQYFGCAHFSPILLVVYPEKYPVLNEPAKQALARLGLHKFEGKDYIEYPKAMKEITERAKECSLSLWQMDWVLGWVGNSNEKYLKLAIEKEASQEIKDKNYHAEGETHEVYVRAKQRAFRKELLTEYDGCALCGFAIRKYLVGAHIVPYAVMRKEEPENAMNPSNGLLLCRFCDVAFDKGDIEIAEDLGITVSEELRNDSSSSIVKSQLGSIPAELQIKPHAEHRPEPKYLRWKTKLLNNKRLME